MLKNNFAIIDRMKKMLFRFLQLNLVKYFDVTVVYFLLFDVRSIMSSW